nr:PD-(D/E)XK nuclease family protein [Planosporangium mesophilum]
MLEARRGDALTRFDGDLSGHDLPDPTGDRTVSPTALEAWVRCPHAYFLGRILRVEPVESPEELVEITPLEVGNLMHAALDRFFTSQEAREAQEASVGTRWSAGQRAELARIATEVGDELTARGATGHPLLWRQELARILVHLDGFLDDDEALRAGTGRRQVRSELAFGMRGVDAVPVALPDGRVVHFKGSADRVDLVGDSIVIVDYKTGSARGFQGICEADPTLKGSKLQLPVYAYAARAALGVPDATVSAEYWFLRKDAGRRRTLELTPQVERAYAEVLAVIVDGIASGLYPGRPPEQDGHGIPCPFCDPDGLGAGEHRDRWARKKNDPRLAAYLNLVEGGDAP